MEDASGGTGAGTGLTDPAPPISPPPDQVYDAFALPSASAMPTLTLAQTPTPPVASNPTPTATTGVQPQAIAGNTPGAAAEGGTARDSPLLVSMTNASGASLGGNVHSSPAKGARDDWEGGLVHVDRKEFVREMGFATDAGGLPVCLGPHREPSPIYTHCGDIFRSLQAKAPGSDGVCPPVSFRIPKALGKNILPYGARKGDKGKPSKNWDDQSLLDVDLSILLTTTDCYHSSCWLAMKCQGDSCPSAFAILWSWADVRNQSSETLPIAFRPTLLAMKNAVSAPGCIPACIHLGPTPQKGGGRASRAAERTTVDPALPLAYAIAANLKVQAHRDPDSTRVTADVIRTARSRTVKRKWGVLGAGEALGVAAVLESASNEYAASYTPEEATEEGAVDHHRTLKTRVLPAAGGTPESFICTSDLDVRTLASAIARLGSKFTAGLDLSSGLMEYTATKQAFKMVALNVYGGPAGNGYSNADPDAKRPEGGGSFTPFWFFSYAFSCITFQHFLLSMVQVVTHVTGSWSPMASLLCDHDPTQLMAICRVFHLKTIGEYFAALQSKLLEAGDLIDLWPLILHDNFHSSGKTRHWNKKHLQGPEHKFRRMLLIAISRALNMLGHPRLYPFIADDGFSAGATMPEPDADEMRNTSQAKARLQRITKWGIEALKFFAYVLQTPDLPFESAELSFTRAHEPLDLKQAHDRRKAFPKNGVWPPPQVPIASEEEEELMDMDEYETTPAEEMNAGADGEGELDEENATEAPQTDNPDRRRRLALASPWPGAPDFCIDMVVGPPDASTGAVKARVTVLAGHTLLVTNKNKVRPNAVGWTSTFTTAQASALLNPSNASAPLWPASSSFASPHAAWYFGYHMAPHMLAASYCTGRRVFTAASSGQEEPFKKVNTHRSNVMRNNKVMALDEGVRLICGLTTSKLTLEKSGFQRHNLLGYLNELRMSRPDTNVVTQSLAHLNVENPAFAEDVASFCKKPVFVKLSKEDPLGAQMVTRLVQVRKRIWPFCGIAPKGGYNNVWNMALCICSAVQCLPALEGDIGFPLLNPNTLQKMLNLEWWFDMATLGPSPPSAKCENWKVRETEVPHGLCYVFDDKKIMPEAEADLCKQLIWAWINAAEDIEQKRGDFAFTPKGSLCLKPQARLQAPPAAGAGAQGTDAGPSGAAASTAGA